MKDFHAFIRTLFFTWLVVYAILLLPGLAKGAAMYVLSDFHMPASHYFDMMSTIYQGALWLVPTAFLAVAYYLSHPNNRTLQG